MLENLEVAIVKNPTEEKIVKMLEGFALKPLRTFITEKESSDGFGKTIMERNIRQVAKTEDEKNGV